MRHRKLPVYAIVSVIAVILLLLLTAASFAGGLILAPYLNGDAQAATQPAAIELTQPAVQVEPDAPELIADFEQALIDLYQEGLPSVVNIRVTQKIEPQVEGSGDQFNFPFGTPFGPFSNPFGRPFMGPIPQTPEEFYNRGQGSGFIWDEEGHIVTNYHVVAGATDVEVIFADDTTVKAEVVGSDPDADLAVIKVDLPDTELQPVTLGDSDELQVGQLAIAIGNPFGQEFTMTSGIISAVGRTIRSGNSPFSIPEVIQTDAAINPGNSGGPLLNREGEVIGINTQIISASGGNAGVGFAIPINIARQIVPTLIEGETFDYAWLGITGTTLPFEVVDFMKLPPDTKGALVIDVAQDSPADEAGLQGSDKTLTVAGAEYQLGGDVIIGINDQPIESMDDLITYLIEETQPDDEVLLTVIRSNGEEENIEVTLGVRPGAENVNRQNK